MGRKKQVEGLIVYLNGLIVGKLKKQLSGQVTFKYDEKWLPLNFAISNSLPVQEQEYKGEVVSRYFDNLLPDNEEIKKAIAEKFAAESKKPFDILSVIGRDCIGALSFLPEGEAPGDPFKLEYTSMSEKKIAQRIRGLSSANPLGMDKGDFRISLAGAQEKMALLRIGKKWYEPKGLTPTTHILKTSMGALNQNTNFSDSVDNECASLMIAKKLGLDTCKTWIEEFEDKRVLIVERFDREWFKHGAGKTLVRIPQEDMCQALGYSPYAKYESDGGPSVKKITDLLATSKVREDRLTFFRSLLIFDLLYAIDGHAKNFSVFLTPSGINLTPAYDIMSGYFLNVREKMPWSKLKLAMAVGKTRYYKFDKITLRHYRETAKIAGIGERDFEDLLEDFKAKVNGLTIKDSELDKNLNHKTLEIILMGLAKRKKWLGL